MNNISKWIKTDLHIHSIESNRFKINDYKGNKYTAEKLLQVLINNSVGLFSITDHNCINKPLYKDLFELLKQEKYSEIINVLIGTELDVFDTTLHNERIHVLCIFDSSDIDTITDAVNELTKRVSTSVYPTIKDIFEVLERFRLYKFILIPHFNNKSNSLPSNDAQIENLNRLIFNAYEDANNHVKLTTSLKVYLKNGFDNFPFLAFSDNHNLDEYPGWKDEKNKKDKLSLCNILGDIEYPFNTIKTAFEEPRLRISIENVDLMRSTNIGYSDFSFQEGDSKVMMSPYMNTIIGPFGSGKSLLFNLILNGTKSMPTKYKRIMETKKLDFMLNIDGHKVNSLKEAVSSNLIDKIITVDQYEELVYVDQIDNKYIQKIAEKLDFRIPKLDSFKFDYDLLLIKNNVDEIRNANKEFTNSYNFNYVKAFSATASYVIHASGKDLETINYNDIYENLNVSNISSIMNLTISTINIFTDNDKRIVNDYYDLISQKTNIIRIIETEINSFQISLNKKIVVYNDSNNLITSKQTKEKVSKITRTYVNLILKLVDSCVSLCKTFDETKFDDLMKKENTESFDDYIITCKFNVQDKEYEDINTRMFSGVFKRDTFVKSFVNALDNIETVKLRGNKSFNSYYEILDMYKKNLEITFIEEKLLYNILVGKDKNSILNLSPGERSQEVLKMVFQRIKYNIEEQLRTVVIIDQPENNMDNKNIMTLLVDKIKEVKLIDRNNYVLFVLVTHNANICITSDSENVIIAKNTGGNFEYTPGSIENEKHISNVCSILEGGIEALKARASKYNINIKRKVTRDA